MIAPVQRTFMIGLPHCGECCRAGRRLAVRSGHAGIVEIAADQAQVQIPALGAPVGALDPRGDDVRVARRDDAHGLQPVQAGALGQAGCSRLAWSPRGRPRCRPARRSWPGRRARTCTRWTAGHCNRPGRVRGSAPTRSPRRSPVTPRPPPARASFPSRSWLTFRPRPFISGHPRHVCARHGRSRTLANLSQQCWKACWRNPVLQAAAMARGLAADGSAGETGRADEC